jgi:hypothetical protein
MTIVPVLRAAPALGCLWRVLAAAGCSWEKAGHLSAPCEDPFAWTLPDGNFCRHPDYIRVVAKMGCFLGAPDQVETAEVLAFLPQSGSCELVRDRANHMYASTAEPLGVLMSQAALLCGDSSVCFDLAVSHAKAAAARHLMPQRIMHAQAALGNALMRRDQVGRSSTREVKEETLAVLNGAIESSRKMKLQRYTELIMEVLSGQ